MSNEAQLAAMHTRHIMGLFGEPFRVLSEFEKANTGNTIGGGERFCKTTKNLSARALLVEIMSDNPSMYIKATIAP